jgi:hypothetical protein
MITLARATILLARFLAFMLIGTIISARLAHAQSFFSPPDGGAGRYHGVMPNPGPYRAINHDPATGRTYAREADDLAPKYRVPKRKTRR